MRRRLALLLVSTVLGLGVAGVVAAPAAAAPPTCTQAGEGERRNVGGTGPADCTCQKPGKGERRNVGGTGPADDRCPLGQVKPPKPPKDKPGRNVGG